MRIITGQFRGRHFDIPRTFKARPTTDFAKENIFNVIRGYMDLESKTALDLFSGTGSISLELVSRGCERVVSVEADREHHAFIRQCLAKLGTENCVPLRMDALRFIKGCREPFDLVFADPPYAMKELPSLPGIILERGLVKSGGLLVFEHGAKDDFSHMPGFVEHRAYGSVNFSLFEPIA